MPSPPPFHMGGYMGRRRPQRSQKHRTPVRKPRLTLTGTVRVVRPGVATVETPEGSFAVARGGLREAMDGDEVQVVLVRRGPGPQQAVVHGVLQRATSSFLGTFEKAEPLGVVVPLDARLRHDFFVLPEDDSPERLQVEVGDVVSARILQYHARQSAGVATIDRRVGSATELDMLVESVIASHGLSTIFSDAALDEARTMRVDADAALRADAARRDLRDLCTLTVDPADARDFDDALSVRRLDDGGYEVGVHIADVTHYVRWGSSIDVEARLRTCSTYLVDRVIPMLPEELCNDVCSLKPGEDRLCMTVLLRLDAHGVVTGAEACTSVIHSHARLSYGQADALLREELSPEDLPVACGSPHEVAEALVTLDEVAQLRREVRERRGAIDFDTREAKVLLDEQGHPTGVSVRERTAATSLVEEAMLIANEAVAKMLADVDAPAAYRVHERPAPESLATTIPLLRELGLVDNALAERVVAGVPAAMQEVLSKARGTGGEYVANALLLRAQKRAIYLPHNDGHYALGASAYCHFTSPIRRYSDDIVHRALKAYLRGALASRVQQEVAKLLPQLCRRCSDQERVADLASRDSQKAKMAQLYLDRIGERYSGIVVGCERYGLFVMLDDTCAEGLLPTRALGEEWFSYDADRMMLVGESTGRTWRLGQRIAVEVTGASPERGQIDFALAGQR